MGFPIKVLAFRIFLLGSMMKLVYLNPIETSSKAFPKALSEADETENGIESSEEQSAVRFDDYEQTEEVFESLQFEEGNNFQGDIDLEPDQLEILMSNDTEDGSSSLTRIGLLSELYRWPKNKHGKVVVPFVISNNAGYTTHQKGLILKGMKEIATHTCVRFVERKDQEDFILINSDSNSCRSKLGRIGGEQTVNLAQGCLKIGTIMHELIHALGYTHMHNHADRDNFVTINWDNILPDHLKNFQKVNLQTYGNFNTRYDFRSVMHYGFDAFSKKKGEPTIIPRNSYYKSKIGQRLKLSKGDKKRINNMYRCDL